VVHRDIAQRLADILDLPFEGVFNAGQHTGRSCYFVPSDTILTAATRDALNIHNELDLFGGYAPHAFIPTKAITHELIGPRAKHPAGWSDAFGHHVRDATLPGYTAFSYQDLKAAAERLLADGRPIRLKPVHATGGRGQILVTTLRELEQAIAQLDEGTLARCGAVLEIHLNDVVTYSVGQVRLPGLTASYVGTQRLTRDNHGQDVYGGSRLQFARGGYDSLQALALNEERRRAVQLAQCYDSAADACYPEFFASRRNYDVAAGTNAQGERLMGVLEQSWRIGGASRAEIAALEIMAGDPSCPGLWAETLELFGSTEAAPADAIETFSGEDAGLGLVRKYIMVHAYGNEQSLSRDPC